jgi:hypothetical protein
LVAHPGQLRLILRSKNKNDCNGAERLAKLLYLSEAPAAKTPAKAMRETLMPLRHRTDDSRVKCCVCDVDSGFGKSFVGCPM